MKLRIPGNPFSSLSSLSRRAAPAGLAAMALTGCREGGSGAAAAAAAAAPPATGLSAPAPRTAGAASDGFTYYTCEVVARYPHDSRAFTQGLLFQDSGTLLESTGLHGRSSLRRVELKTGRILQQVDLPARHFGEGLTLLKGRLYQLTWKDGVGFIYDSAGFEKLGEFTYTGEGWGLTTDGTSLILSDGTSTLRFLSPADFTVTRSITVSHQGKPVDHLNELEYIDGKIYANLWGADLIVIIDPASGQASGLIDCRSLFPAAERSTPEQVLNGIAWDPAAKRLLLTGKWWPELYEVRLMKTR